MRMDVSSIHIVLNHSLDGGPFTGQLFLMYRIVKTHNARSEWVALLITSTGYRGVSGTTGISN